jgi:hemolysin activation/secretion protein
MTGCSPQWPAAASLAPAQQKRYDGRMIRFSITFLVSLLIVAMASAMAQADDVAAERARLANQRIQVEEERRAREEEERLEQAQTQPEPENLRGSTMETASASDQPQETSSAPASRGTQTSASGAPVDRIEMSRVLEQLRELGALREAGYVTEEEFEQLKKKILDSAL